jgi:hypothetical protein
MALTAATSPSSLPQRDYLLFFVVTQNIAHVDAGYSRVGINVLDQIFRWPLFR